MTKTWQSSQMTSLLKDVFLRIDNLDKLTLVQRYIRKRNNGTARVIKAKKRALVPVKSARRLLAVIKGWKLRRILAHKKVHIKISLFKEALKECILLKE